MRIADLSRESGVPAPTIKYYVREGLLPPGELTSPNQAQYGEGHLRRLKLIRALTEVGGLSIAATRSLLDAASSPGRNLHDALGKAQYATTPPSALQASPDARDAATRQADELITRRGWQVKPDSPARELLAGVLATLRDLDADDLLALADDYAGPAEQIAAADLKTVLDRPTLDAMLEGVIIGAVLGDALLAALRRLAQENASSAITQSGGSPGRQ
ncbi:MAG TPA: MerR family transcriptional regulator [Streptosporangiaceae bacterium]